MRVIYISGPYSNGDFGKVCENIMRARRMAIKLWQTGYAVICPHSNTAHFEAHIKDPQVFIDGDLEILKRCDAIYMLRGWESSEGSKQENQLARGLNLEIIYE